MFSREDIQNIIVGKTKIAFGVNGYFYDPEVITDILLSGETEDGRLYVVGRATFQGQKIMFCVEENDPKTAKNCRILG